jgi:molybdopterin/thiamine biosynthesis adenylyltransferase
MNPNRDTESCSAVLLDTTRADDAGVLAELRADPGIEVLDTWAVQHGALLRALAACESDLADEAPRWAYYPWRRSLVKILGPQSFRRLRLDRNRNLITLDEQDRLGRLRVGVVGLSSGHVIAHTLAAQGLCGELRLADFDELELSNLNRVPASMFDLGVNKATATARRIAELDPYLSVQPWPSGLAGDNIEAFLDTLDVVVEECDSLDVKALVRQEARARQLPVVMATSDRGLIDVERFDLEPDRPLFHGLLGTVDVAALSALSSQQKVPHVMRLVDVTGLTARAAASLLEVGQSLATWPQLAGDVTLGAGGVAEVVRRIGLNEPLASGRVRLDVGAALDRIEEPSIPGPPEPYDAPEELDEPAQSDLIGAAVTAAIRAPSGGNTQQWSIEVHDEAVDIMLAPELTSIMDVGFRGSAVAVGAAVLNATAAVAAVGNGVVARVDYVEPAGPWPLRATLRLVPGTDPARAAFYPSLLHRETNRHHGAPRTLADDVLATLANAATGEGARLRVMTERAQIDSAADLLAAADRVRYLTPPLHADMTSELRWPGDAAMETGIDVRSLELDPGTLQVLDILTRPEVMAALAAWDGGRILGADTRARVASSSALAVITVDGTELTDYARGGAAAEAVWITAQKLGLAVQPISPAFLYARTDADFLEVSQSHAAELSDLSAQFGDLAGLTDDAPALILRLAVTPPATVKSRRRSVNYAVRRYPVSNARKDSPRQP